MKKQATQDVKNIYYAIATVADDGAVTYGTPKKIFDLQKISLSISSSTEKHYTSDGPDIINSFEGGTITIGTYGIDNATLAELEGHEVDSNHVVIEKATDEAPYVAIGFQAEKRNGKNRFVWLVLCKKKLDNEEYAVKESKINPQPTTLTFEISERADGQWRNKVDEDDTDAPANLKDKWFKKVYDGKLAA